MLARISAAFALRPGALDEEVVAVTAVPVATEAVTIGVVAGADGVAGGMMSGIPPFTGAGAGVVTGAAAGVTGAGAAGIALASAFQFASCSSDGPSLSSAVSGPPSTSSAL